MGSCSTDQEDSTFIERFKLGTLALTGTMFQQTACQSDTHIITLTNEL